VDLDRPQRLAATALFGYGRIAEKDAAGSVVRPLPRIMEACPSLVRRDPRPDRDGFACAAGGLVAIDISVRPSSRLPCAGKTCPNRNCTTGQRT